MTIISENIPSAELKIIPKFIFRTTNPMVFGVSVFDGAIKINDKVYADQGLNIYVGKIISIRSNDKDIEHGNHGEEICIKINSKLIIGTDILIANSLYCKNN